MVDNISMLNDDALQNEWEIIIPPFIGAIDPVETSLRVTQVNIPEQSVSEYDVNYKTRKVTKFGGKITTPNEFSFTFRVDKYWNVYQGLRNWHNLISNNLTGEISTDYTNGISALRVPIKVNTINSLGTITSVGWLFEGCAPKMVPAVDLNYDTGDALVISINMNFVKMY